MRSEKSDRGTWSAFWLAILGNSTDFLSIFFVCDSNSCILIKTSRVRVMETLDSTELFIEDQTWLDYLWDFETRGINLDLPSDTD